MDGRVGIQSGPVRESLSRAPLLGNNRSVAEKTQYSRNDWSVLDRIVMDYHCHGLSIDREVKKENSR